MDLSTLKIAIDTTDFARAKKEIGDFTKFAGDAEKKVTNQTKTATAEAAAIHKQAGIILLQDWKQRGALESAIHKQTGGILLQQWKQRGADEKAIHKQTGDELLMQYKQFGAQEAAIHKQNGAILLSQWKERGAAAKAAASNSALEAKALNDLRASLDPVYASTQRLNQSKATLSAALKSGSISITEYNSLLAKAGRSTSIMDKYSHQFKRTLLDLTPIISGVGLLTLAHGAIQATDKYTKLTSQLKIATNSAIEYGHALSEVKRISSAAQADITSITSLYQRLSLATQASGVSQKEIAMITETVALGLKANGASARESASAMLQLSQSFGSGRMAGEEFNSMAEAAPNVLRALAKSMGVPYGMLKTLASETKITTAVMVKAFTDPALLETFRVQAASMRTITGSWVELTNALVLYVGETSKASGGVGVISGALSFLADNLKLVADALIALTLVVSVDFAAAFIKKRLLIIESTNALIASTAATKIATLVEVEHAKANLVQAANTALVTGERTVATAAMTRYTVATAAATEATAAHAAASVGMLGKLSSFLGVSKLGIIGLALWGAYEVADHLGWLDSVADKAAKRIKELQKLAGGDESGAAMTRAIAFIDTQDKAALQAKEQLFALKKHGIEMATLTAEGADKIISARLAAIKESLVNGGFGGSQESLNINAENILKLETLTKVLQRFKIELSTPPDSFAGIMGDAGSDAAWTKIQEQYKTTGFVAAEYETKKQAIAAESFAKQHRLSQAAISSQKDASAEILAVQKAAAEALIALDKEYAPKKIKEHQSAMLMMATELDAKIKSDNEALSNSERVSLAWTKLKDSEKTAAEALNYVKAQSAAIALDEIAAGQEFLKLSKSIADDSNKEIEAIDKKIAAQAKHNAEIGKTPAQIAAIASAAELVIVKEMELESQALRSAAATVDMEQQYKDLYIRRANALDEQINKRKKLAGLEGDASIIEANDAAIKAETKAHEEMWKKVDGFAHTAFDNIFDKGKNAFEEIGKVIKKSILDMLYKMTVQKWIFSIGTTSAGVGASGMAGAAGIGGADGGSSWLSAGKSIYDGFSGAFTYSSTATTGLSGMFNSFATSGMGQSLGLGVQGELSLATGEFASSVSELGSTVGTLGSYVGAGMAGITLGSMIAGDKTVIGLDGKTASAIGTAIGAFWGPPGMLIGGILGGVFSAAFGMGPKQSGTTTLAGQFGGEGFAGQYQTPWSQKGGWFRSNRSGMDVQGVGAEQQSALNAVVVGTKSVFDNLISASGDANKSIAGWTFAINRQVSTQEQQNQLIIDMADSMGSYMIPSLEAFKLEGENLADTAVRMRDEFILTDSILRLVGGSFGAVGLASMGARDNLVQLMGGIQDMNTTMQSYYQNFFTDAERHANDLGALTLQFAYLGLSIPQSASGFKNLVSAQDLSTESGRQMFAALMSLQGAFAALIPSAEASAQAIEANIKSLQDKAIADYNAARQATDSLRAFALSVRELQQALWAGSQTPLSSTYAVTRSQFAATNVLAGAGDTNAQGNLAGAATQFLDASKKQATSAIEYARDFAFVQNSLDATATLTENVVSVADRQLEELIKANAWLSALDTKNATQNMSITDLVGVSVASVTAANAAAIASEAAITPITTNTKTTADVLLDINKGASAGSTATATPIQTLTSTGGGGGILGSIGSAIGSVFSSIGNFFGFSDPRLKENIEFAGKTKHGLNLYDFNYINDHTNARYRGLMSTEVRSVMPSAVTQIGGYDTVNYGMLGLEMQKLPAFAIGTNEVPFDMNARIHAGEEIKPRQFVEKDKSDKKETNELLRKLIAANDDMKKELVAIKSTNYKMWQIDDKHDIEGMPDVRAA